MKREHSKRTVHAGAAFKDMPVAAACDADSESPEPKLRGCFADNGGIFRFGGENGDPCVINGIGGTVFDYGSVRTTLRS